MTTEVTAEETLCAQYVKDRVGWTDTLIRNFLGEPDELKTNPFYRCASPMRLYFLSRVESIEATCEWQEAAQKAIKRQRIAKTIVVRKKKELVDELKPLRIKVPKMSRSKLVECACDSYNSFRENRVDYDSCASPNSDKNFLDRLCVNYLRHNLSSYETELGNIFGRVGKAIGYKMINKKIYWAISRAYPELAKECRDQQNRKFETQY